MRTIVVLLLGIILMFSLSAVAQEETKEPQKFELKTEKEKVSYALGYQIANSMKMDDLDLDLQVFARAFEDVLKGGKSAMTDEEIRQTMTDFQQKMVAKRREAQKKEGEENLAAAKKFLEENKQKEGVKELPSGLQYIILKEGTGKSPKATDTVKVNYRGTLINGEEFDSSERHGGPAELALNRVIPGWTEAVQLMKEGAKWQLFVPPDLAYGERSMGPMIPPNSLLIFEIELIEVMGDQSPKTDAAPEM